MRDRLAVLMITAAVALLVRAGPVDPGVRAAAARERYVGGYREPVSA